MYFAYGQTRNQFILKAKKTARLAAVIDRLGHNGRTVDTDLFSSVVHHIIRQQISTKHRRPSGSACWDALGTVTADSIAAAGVFPCCSRSA
ncbi:MAG: DNA repair protein [Butyricicoccus sp.]